MNVEKVFRLEAKDIVAITSIICCSALVYLGKDGAIVTLLATVVGWYFGHRPTARGKTN